MQPVSYYFIGFDLGKDRDHSAIAIMAYGETPDGTFDYARYGQPMRPVLDLVSLIRIPVGTEYLDVMQRLRSVVTKLLASNPWGYRPPVIYLVVDAAGPGHVAVELIRAQQLNIQVIATVLSSGTETNHLKNGKVTIPRRDLLSNACFLLEAATLRIAGGLRFADALEKEFSEVRPDGNQSAHDDLAIATALAAWHATRVFPALRGGRRAA